MMNNTIVLIKGNKYYFFLLLKVKLMNNRRSLTQGHGVITTNEQEKSARCFFSKHCAIHLYKEETCHSDC